MKNNISFADILKSELEIGFSHPKPNPPEPGTQIDVSSGDLSPNEQLAANVHDINNELVKLSAGLDVLATQFPEEHSLIKLMRDAVNAIEELSYNSVAIMRGDERFRPADIPVPEFIADLIQDALNCPWSNNVQMVSSCQYNGTLFMDPVLFGGCLHNLIKNACEAMHANQNPKRLQVQVFQPWGGKLCFRVADNGPGLPKDVDVFAPRTSAHGDSCRGHGLASVRHTVFRHGGNIQCTTSSTGTTFDILVPLDGGKSSA